MTRLTPAEVDELRSAQRRLASIRRGQGISPEEWKKITHMMRDLDVLLRDYAGALPGAI